MALAFVIDRFGRSHSEVTVKALRTDLKLGTAVQVTGSSAPAAFEAAVGLGGEEGKGRVAATSLIPTFVRIASRGSRTSDAP